MIGAAVCVENSMLISPDPPSDNVTLDTSMDFGMIGDPRTIREVSSTVDGDYCYVYE